MPAWARIATICVDAHFGRLPKRGYFKLTDADRATISEKLKVDVGSGRNFQLLTYHFEVS
jgi:endonuclease III